MNIQRIDLNLLVYLDVLLQERNVTKAASHLSISQPAMSNSLRRLRLLFEDQLLVRTSEGMVPTERAQALQPLIRDILAKVEQAVEPQTEFDPKQSQRIFRISASDYGESTLMPAVLHRLRQQAPQIIVDILTPSDTSFTDVEQGKVDMIINRFDMMHQSLHQMTLWEDSFSCVMNQQNPIREQFDLSHYLQAQHVWVSKTGMGVGIGVDPHDVQRLGWVDNALNRIGHKRRITAFTRHYQSALHLAAQNDLLVTIPTKAALLLSSHQGYHIEPPPFEIPPIELKMAWSPLLQHNADHRWMRRLIASVAKRVAKTVH